MDKWYSIYVHFIKSRSNMATLWINSVTDPDPRSWFSPIPDSGSRIPDPKTAKKRGVKKMCCHNLISSHKFHNIENYFLYEMLKKKKLGQFSKNYRTFCPKNCHKALKNMGLGSGIRKKPIPDPGSRGHKGTGSRIRIRNTEIYVIKKSKCRKNVRVGAGAP